MNVTFENCSMDSINHLVTEYVSTLSSPFDSFLDDHIVDSTFYIIKDAKNEIGYFAIHNDRLLTQFYLKHKYLKIAQDIFTNVLTSFTIKRAFVPTCDELFLSLVIDQEFSIEKQAYFFQDNKQFDSTDKLYQGADFRVALKEDIRAIESMSGDFFDNLGERIDKEEIFVLTDGEVLLGAGIIEKGRFLKGYTSIGMITNERYRLKGVGRSIIIHLKDWCYKNNQIPVCGCWYYNTHSKSTLESAGMVTKTRLLNVKFK